MNVGNILKVADAIEQASVPGLGFNMDHWKSTGSYRDQSGRDCGTTACICGWAATVEHKHLSDDETYMTFGQSYFGLDQQATERLFLYFTDDADEIVNNRNEVTPEQAVRTLRILAITGKVDWEAAMKPADPVMPSLPTPVTSKVRA